MNYSGDDTSLDFWIIVVESGIRYLPQDVICVKYNVKPVRDHSF